VGTELVAPKDVVVFPHHKFSAVALVEGTDSPVGHECPSQRTVCRAPLMLGPYPRLCDDGHDLALHVSPLVVHASADGEAFPVKPGPESGPSAEGKVPGAVGEGGGASLHYGNPWADPPAARDPARRLRGHLVLPVTVWLVEGAGAGPAPIGLTVSSVLLGQGEPPMLAGLVTPSSDLGEKLAGATERFVVHLLGATHRRLAQHFAGDVLAPADQLTTSTSAHGPVLEAVSDRIFCQTTSVKAFGWSLLVEARVDDIQVGAMGKGLAWFRGAFHVLDS